MRNLLLLFLVLLVPAAAFADPLPLTDDLTGTITVYYDEQDPSAGRYEYSYRFPRIDPDNAAAYLVNNFYESEVRYVDVYDAPTMADYYADLGEDYTVRITYEITLNSDEYFSVRLTKVMEYEGETAVIWEGNTFSRESGMPGSVFSLPNLLGRLEAGETDDWLEDRQVQKVRSAVYRLVWDQISGRVEDLPYPDYIGVPFSPKDDPYPYPPEAARMTYDGLHPTDEGCEILAELFAEQIRRTIRTAG